MLTVQQALQQLRTILEKNPHLTDAPLVLPVKVANATVGPSPVMDIQGFHAGFDWDSGKVLCAPNAPLAIAGEEFVHLRKKLDALASLRYMLEQALADKQISERDILQKIKSFL